MKFAWAVTDTNSDIRASLCWENACVNPYSEMLEGGIWREVSWVNTDTDARLIQSSMGLRLVLTASLHPYAHASRCPSPSKHNTD